jgi:hypothetical protein
MPRQRQRQRFPAFLRELGQLLQAGQGLLMQVMGLIDKQCNGFLPRADELQQLAFAFFGLGGS